MNDLIGTNPAMMAVRHAIEQVAATDATVDTLSELTQLNGLVLNGTKINGPTKIAPGDEITICTRRMKFVAGDPPSIKAKSKSIPPPVKTVS